MVAEEGFHFMEVCSTTKYQGLCIVKRMQVRETVDDLLTYRTTDLGV